MNPLLIIWDVRQRSVLHFAQCKRLVWPERSWEVGATIGAVDGGRVVVLLEKGLDEVEAVVAVEASDTLEKVVDVLEALDVESLDDWRERRRKGRDGARKVGKKAGFA